MPIRTSSSDRQREERTHAPRNERYERIAYERAARRVARHRTQDERSFNPAIRRGIIAVLLFLAAILATLSFFNLAGVVGQFVDLSLAFVFGVTRYIIPVLLVVWAVIIEKEEDLADKPHHLVGFILFLLGANGLVHAWVPIDTMVDTALQGYRGGMLGLALGWTLVRFTSIWAAVPIMALVTVIGLMLITSISVSDVFQFMRAVLEKFWRYLTDSIMYTRARLASAQSTDAIEAAEAVPDVRAHTLPTPPPATDSADEDENENVDENVELEQQELKLPPKQKHFKPLPAFELLVPNKSKPTAGDIKSNGELIVETLKQFGIGCELAEVRVGPTVTQYAIRPDKGVKLTRITALSNDLALALAAHPIRIEAPIPGKPFVGIEVPNERVALVTLRELFESDEFSRRASHLSMTLGKDVSGKVWVADLSRMPHLLVAGATGSGKTVCLNTLIMSLIYQNTEQTLRFIMVDPKRVELTSYNGLPHLLTPVITDPSRAVNALKWCISEMERRYELLAKIGSRDIASYNKKMGHGNVLPYIVFIIDEVADLMLSAGPEIEGGIIRIAQMARAVGIHLIIATQRPSVDVITGLMKANIPARIAFSVASIIDSRTILDSAGAEKLLGRGDMLFQTAELQKPKRLQGAFVSEEELKRVMDYWKSDTAPDYNPIITEKQSGASGSVFSGRGNGGADDTDPMFEAAKQVVIESGKASASLLQRRLKLGYSRAARIIDELERAGVVGPADGAKPRDILLLPEGNDDIIDETAAVDDAVFDEEHEKDV